MSFVYSVDQVRRAEQVLLDAQSAPDQLMQQAARSVAAAAEVMLAAPRSPIVEGGRVLLLVGSGGNGGDALYAGEYLAVSGVGVDAVLLGREGRVHEPALAAFRAAGGRVLEELPLPQSYRLLIDGILGLGGSGGLSPAVADLVHDAKSQRIPILAVDIPSGISADTGALPEEVLVDARGFAPEDSGYALQKLPAHVPADVTITFGGLRRGHAVSPHCGEVLLADLTQNHDGRKLLLSLELFQVMREDFDRDEAEIQFFRAWAPENGPFNWSISEIALEQLNTGHWVGAAEPGAEEDKYSGGVVGICAGSQTYPGAGILSATGAVRATSSMVRYIGGGADEVVRALPEVIVHPDVESSGRVQAWVVGSGRGADGTARTEMAWLLDREEPLVMDADAITLLSQHAEIREQLRGREAVTVLTPHAGEFARLAGSLETRVPELRDDRLAAVFAVARELDCTVLLKGRHTIVATPQIATIIDAGSSWGATAGSGDVLGGIIGANLAQMQAREPELRDRFPQLEISELMADQMISSTVAHSVRLHAVAAALSAQTPEGPAPTSASRIAEAIPRANARLAKHGR